MNAHEYDMKQARKEKIFSVQKEGDSMSMQTSLALLTWKIFRQKVMKSKYWHRNYSWDILMLLRNSLLTTVEVVDLLVDGGVKRMKMTTPLWDVALSWQG